MFIHRQIIYPILCASALLSSAGSVAQQPSRVPSAAAVGQSYTPPARTPVGSREDQSSPSRQTNQENPQDQRNNRVQANARAVPPENNTARSNSRAEANARVVRGSNNKRAAPPNDVRPEARVVPGENARLVPREGDKSARVVPGSSMRAAPGGAARVVPGSGAVVPAGRVIPGTRPAGQRPVVVRRTLPQKIILDRRCSACPYVTLSPYAVSKKGDLIELDDGSVWEVRRRDRRMVKRWKPDDAILVETGTFLSWSSYRLVNYTRGESADVELALGTDFQGRHSHWIVEVNPLQGFVRLEDGSIWHMSASDLAQWKVNDDVIIGLSKDMFSDQYNYILINPRAKNRIIAIFEF